MTDAIALLHGYVREIVAEGGGMTLNLLVKPDADFDGRFKAWDRDAEGLIAVNGWLFEIEAAEPEYQVSEGALYAPDERY